MPKSSLITTLVLFTAFAAVARKRAAELRLDYTRPGIWQYSLDYNARCIITDGDSTSSIDSRIMCGLTGKPNARGDRFTFTVATGEVESHLYTLEQQKQVVDSLTGTELGLALIAGCPVVDTLSSFSMSLLSEWDLVLQFAKLLPDMPVRPVRKGFTWERSGIHPLVTSLGEIPCEVYRLYKVDSLSSKGDSAYVSWQFRYAAARLAVDTSFILKRVPVSGNGRGTAAIDIVGAALSHARVTFRTPVAKVGDAQIFWEENTVLRRTTHASDTH